MLFRETVKFYTPSIYDEKTGNYIQGDTFEVHNLDVRVYGTIEKNTAEMNNDGRVLSIRSREPFPLNHLIEWNGKRWKIQMSNFDGFFDKRRRHWFSARYLEQGDI